MTHEELRNRFPRAQALSPGPCPGGRLVCVDAFPDLVVDHDGTVRERAITIYRCQGCGHLVPVADGKILFGYAPPERETEEPPR